MAKTGKKQLRAAWLQVHKWIGLTLAILIIPISLTGSALVWHDWLDAKLEPQRHATLGPATLAPSAYAAARDAPRFSRAKRCRRCASTRTAARSSPPRPRPPRAPAARCAPACGSTRAMPS